MVPCDVGTLCCLLSLISPPLLFLFLFLTNHFQFIETLPNGRLQWIEECGHVPHLEKPEETADAIAEYLSSDVSVPDAGGLSQQSLVVGGIVGATAVAAVANIL